MSDPIRSEALHTSEPATTADREAKIEQLLLAGLDQYLGARYEQAINIWSRALFIDRSHARTRAYLERARAALAERQREAEALLYDGAAAIDRGDSPEARRLLHAALARGDAVDETLILLDRIARLDGTRDAVVDRETARSRLTLDPPQAGRSSAGWIALGMLTLVIVVAGAFAATASKAEWSALVERSMRRQSGPHAAATPGVADEVPAVPRRAAMTLDRARGLMQSGRLHDAVALLESVPPAAPERREADRLRADVQRQLIALGSVSRSDAVQPIESGHR